MLRPLSQNEWMQLRDINVRGSEMSERIRRRHQSEASLGGYVAITKSGLVVEILRKG